MKKITLILTLALACFGVTTMSAQVQKITAIGEEVTDATNLNADENYVIKVVAHYAANTGDGTDVTDGTQFLTNPISVGNAKRIGLGALEDNYSKRASATYISKVQPATDAEGFYNISIGGGWISAFSLNTTTTNESGFSTGDTKGLYKLTRTSDDCFTLQGYTNTTTAGAWLNYVTDKGVWVAYAEARAMKVKIYKATVKTYQPLTNKAVRITDASMLQEGRQYVLRNIGGADRRGYVFEDNRKDGQNRDVFGVTIGDEAWNADASGLYEDNIVTITGSATEGFTLHGQEGTQHYQTFKLTASTGEAKGVWILECTDGSSSLNLNTGHTNTWYVVDDANAKWEIYPVNGDFEDVSATFVVTDTEGNEITRQVVTGTIDPALGQKIAPTFTTQTSSDYYTLTYNEEDVANGATVNVTYTENLPFKVSKSFDKAVWYGMKNHKTYNVAILSDNGANNYIALDPSIEQDLLNDANLWCFVGNAFTGYKIYNKQAGAAKILSSVTNITAEATTNPILTNEDEVTANGSGLNTYWAITPGHSSISNGFYIGQQGFPGHRLNNRESKVAYWLGGADAGSTFTVELAYTPFKPNTDAVYRITFKRATSVIGAYPYRHIENPADETNPFEGGACANADGIIQDTPDTYRYASTEQDTQEAGTLMQFVATDAQGKYQIRCLNACDGTNDFRLGSVKDSKLAITKYPDGYGTYIIDNPSDGVFLLVDANITGNDKYLNCHFNPNAAKPNKSQHIGLWRNGANDEGNVLLIEEVTSLTQDISAAGWASATYPVAVTIPAGMKAYNATSVEGGVVKLEEMTGVIPARTPVFLEATQGNYPMAFAAEEGTAPASSVLTGTLVERRDVSANSYYALGLDSSNQVALMKANVTEMPANKAVILADKVTSGIYASLKLEIGGETTGIDGVNRIDTENTQYFDLKGRRVMFPTNGIFVTNTGKKVFIK